MDELIMSRYRVIQTLGEGGVGKVYYGWDEELQRPVAVKRRHPKASGEPEDGVEGWKEARALAALQHPNIVTLYDFGFDEGGAFFIMEYLQGETLEDRLRRGAMGVTELLLIAYQTLEGLLAAHSSGVIHRDVKPSNLMLLPNPGGDIRVKILDFGLARFQMVPQKQTQGVCGSIMGSIYYMAPEQFGNKPLDGRTDLYALGHVFYHALAGHPAHQRATIAEMIGAHLVEAPLPIREVRGDVAPDLADWIHRLMQKAPDQRPDSALEALRMLRCLPTAAKATAHYTIPALPAKAAAGSVPGGGFKGPAAAAPAPSASRRGWWVGWGAGLVLLAGIGAYFMAVGDRGKPEAPPASGLPGVVPGDGMPAPTTGTPPVVSGPPKAPIPPPAVVVDVKPLGAYAGSSPALPASPKPVPDRVPAKTLVLTPAAVAPPSRPGPGGELSPLDVPALRAKIGQNIMVKGMPVKVGESRSGSTLYLNFTDNYRESLALVFFKSRHPGLTRQGLEGYVGKQVRAAGRVEEYEGRLQIVVPSLDVLKTD